MGVKFKTEIEVCDWFLTNTNKILVDEEGNEWYRGEVGFYHNKKIGSHKFKLGILFGDLLNKKLTIKENKDE